MTFDLDFAAWWDYLEELHIDMGVGRPTVFSSVLNHWILITITQDEINVPIALSAFRDGDRVPRRGRGGGARGGWGGPI